MKLYKVSQKLNNNYDTYDSMIVCADNEEEAKKWLSQALNTLEKDVIERIIEKIDKMPQGQTADGKHHWVSAEAITNLKIDIKKKLSK